MQANTEAEEVTRDRLLSGFLAAVKVCQVRYGGRTELATETDPRVATLCQCLEETLIHGLRIKIASRGIGAIRQVTDFVSSGLNLHLTLNNSESEKPVLWWYVREFLTKHEFDRFLLLRNVTTDEGRGRAWLRSLLNEHSLERYIHIMLSDQEYLEQWYEPWALLRDQERSAVLPNLAAGLDSILFAINIDNETFNIGSCKSQGKEGLAESSKIIEPEPHVAQVVENNPSVSDEIESQRKLETKRKKKKKIPSQLVSFDEDVLSHSFSPTLCESPPAGCFSAPSTSINSPASLSSEDQGISKFSKLVGNVEIKEAKQKLETILNEHSEAALENSTGTPSFINSSMTLPLNRKSNYSTQTELSYSETLEDLLASETSIDSMANAIFDAKKYEKLKMEQETGSFKSIASNVSCDSFQSSEDVGGLPSLIPLEGETGGLIPLSPEGEVMFNVGIAQDDETSLKSSSQDEFEINECITEDVNKKGMSNSSSIGSVASGGSGPPSSNSKCSTVTPSSFSSLTFDELRTAVLEISRTRDASEQKRAALAGALNTEMETSSTLRAQLAQEQSQHKESIDRLSSKVNALTRENELLRHQLKKYIGAVQMLRRDTENQAEDSVFSLPSKNPPEIRDYHDEATAYEGKLIQVAEMHGELMEFNERLQRLLKLREYQVQRLRDELVELRGPFPTAEDDDDLDETLSVTSDFDSISPSPRTLINIWIPTAFLAGPSSDTHHVYQIYVRIKDDEWNVYRRFAQFYELHKKFKKKDAAIRTFDFPQKKAFGNKDISVVEDRRIRLQQYLRQLINFLVSSNPELASQPSKSTLTNLLPFLLDSTPPKETCSKNTNRRKFLSRLSTRQELPTLPQSSPQYNGL